MTRTKIHFWRMDITIDLIIVVLKWVHFAKWKNSVKKRYNKNEEHHLKEKNQIFPMVYLAEVHFYQNIMKNEVKATWGESPFLQY